MLSFGSLKTAKFLIADSVMAHVPTHFSGRTLICGGVGVCPMCPYERPRLKSYVVAVAARRLELIELCASLRECVEQACRDVVGSSILGLVVVAERTAVRRPWRLVASEWKPELVHQADVSPMAWLLADLYKLPPGPANETLEQVVRRGGQCHAPFLRGALLPGLA